MMNTRVLMVSSSVFLGLIGLALSFIPQEVLGILGMPATQPAPLLLQLAGGSLVGWALLNWSARGFVMGGIYSRPLTLGNLVHFAVVAFALGKSVAVIDLHWLPIVSLLGYAGFAACFGYLVFGQGAACVSEA